QVEGLTLYYGVDGTGYLIGASDSDSTYLVYRREGDNEYVGRFSVVSGEGIDGADESNGIDVTNMPLGEAYPEGLFVASDDSNTDPDDDTNFKLVSWGDIAAALDLTVDTTNDPRLIGMEADVTASAATLNAGVDIASVFASAETQPVPNRTDAADDPAIWIHPTDPTLSTIIGTDKEGGMVVYNLDGEVIQYVAEGALNNVDLRYNFPLDGELVALVTVANRTDDSLVIYRVNPETRELEDVAARAIEINGVRAVYGSCMYHSPFTGSYYFIVNDKSGNVEQWELFDDGNGLVDAVSVRTFNVGGQLEGCVADDELGYLYIGEEAEGVWRYGAEPDDETEAVEVDNTGADGHLTADVEGMSIYYGPDSTGYLLVSSQGSHTFVVYERAGDNAYVGTFRIVDGDDVDAVSETDGLDVTNLPLGEAYPEGLFVAQDDRNIDPNATQNFKLVSWTEIAAALGLMVDTSRDPRLVGAE
ncbi:MAG: phytase, partial [Burkholderiales bacterium]|nr:phytase [Anaerolineae bacterium]